MDGLKIVNILTTIRLIFASERIWVSKLSLIFCYLLGCFKVRCMTYKNGHPYLYMKSRVWNPFILFSDVMAMLEIPSHIIVDKNENDKVYIREITK